MFPSPVRESGSAVLGKNNRSPFTCFGNDSPGHPVAAAVNLSS
jgi:hypothetical protein